MKKYRHEYSLSFMCEFMKVSRSGYYEWLGRVENSKTREDRGLKQLEQSEGVAVSRRRIGRLD
jgi:hypothetical protein